MKARRSAGTGSLGRIAALVVGVVLLAAPLRAQVATGTILGNVKDASGASVPGATVTATNLDTQFSRSTASDDSGQYALRLLPLGNYKIEVTLDGFKNFAQTGIVVEIGRNARIDATIEPGAVSEVVSVTADSPLVESNTASLSRTVNQNDVLNLPLVNRDLYSLLSITGGVTSNENSNSLGGPEQLTTINGSQRAQIGTVSFQLDGGNNTAGLRGTGNPAPNPEAIQEFRVITNNYAAEYGRYPAGIVDVVTKSGTNQFRGAAFEFFRDESLNAKRWAPPGVTSAKDPLDRNQYGAAVGGPIRKEKTFFFASYSGLRQEETYYRNTAVVPTALERAGNFSQSAIKPRDPLTNALFPGDVIPSSRFDAAALAIQDRYVPASNLPNNFYEIRRPDPINSDEGTLKLDHTFTDNRSFAVSYFFQKGHRHAAAVVDRQHPVGRSRLRVEPAQPQRHRYVDAEPDDLQSAPLHLRAAVRRARQQSGHVARRFELHVQDSGRSHTSPPDRVRLLHRADVDCRPRRRQRLLLRQGQPVDGPRQSLVQVRRRAFVREHRARHAARQLRRVLVQRQQDR